MTLPPPAAGELLHWEDFEPGQIIDLGTRIVPQDEILSFGRTFDPQPVHVDLAAAEASMFGRLFASGWHSCAILMRLMCDGLLNRTAALGAGGVDEARFAKPVFADEPMTARATCKGKRELRSKPDVGTCRFLFELVNPKGETALSIENDIFLRRRTPAAKPAA
jgi:acyl dehydratase